MLLILQVAIPALVDQAEVNAAPDNAGDQGQGGAGPQGDAADGAPPENPVERSRLEQVSLKTLSNEPYSTGLDMLRLLADFLPFFHFLSAFFF